MSYFKINDVDYSNCVNELVVNSNATYTAQVNAAGDTVVDYINSKREIEVGIIPLDQNKMKQLLAAVNGFTVNVSFLNPSTNQLEKIDCIIPESNVEYYTVQAGKTLFKAFQLKFIEL